MNDNCQFFHLADNVEINKTRLKTKLLELLTKHSTVILIETILRYVANCEIYLILGLVIVEKVFRETVLIQQLSDLL